MAGMRVASTIAICTIVSLPLAAATLARTRLIIETAPTIWKSGLQQPPPVNTRRFEVASVKPCELGGNGRGAAGGRGGGGIPVIAPGRLNLGCQTARQLINQAYILYAGGKRNNLLANPIAIDGGPDWINTARFEISATTDPNSSQEMMRGPMLQALLEDRFKLAVH